MTGLNLLNTSRNSQAFSPGFAPTDLGDTAAAALQSVRQNYNTDAEIRLIGDPLNQRNSLIEERLGRTVFNLTGTDAKYPNPTTAGRIEQLEETNNLLDDHILRGRKEQPGIFDGIQTTAEIREEGKRKAQEAMKDSEETAMRNPSTLSRVTGSLTGSIAGAFTDPFNIATLPLGAGETKIVGTGAMAVARGIAMSAAKEGIIQAGVQAAAIPQIQQWQEFVGNRYGLAEAGTDVALGFLGGFGIRGAGEGIVTAVRGVKRGAGNGSSVVLDKVSDAPALPRTVKDSLKYMERVAYVDEATPAPLKSMGDLQAHRAAVDKVVDDIGNYRRPAVEMPGTTKITTPRNDMELDVVERVVDLDDLITSDNPAFDQSLQPRDRSNRIASDVRINEIAARLDPAQLADSRVSNTGAPIVGDDMMVESGNGRVMAIGQAYEKHPERAAAYRQYIESRGYRTKGMNRPVLIRQRVSEMTPAQRRDFVIFSNEDVADRLSTTERAMADANLLNDNILADYKGGDLDAVVNASFVRRYIDQVVSPAERNSFLTPQGKVSQDGLRRMRAGLLANAYSEPAIVQRLLEDADTNIQTIGKVLMDLSGSWSKMRSAAAAGDTPKEFDITGDLMAAVQTVVEARNQNRPITDFVNQRGLFAENEITPAQAAILRGMYNPKMSRPLGYDKTREFLDFYLREVEKIQGGPDLLGGEKIAPIDVLEASLKKLHGKDYAIPKDRISPADSRVASDEKGAPGSMSGAGDQTLAAGSQRKASPSGFDKAKISPSRRKGEVVLGDIDRTSNSIIYHNHDNAKELLDAAEKLKPDLDKFLADIASRTPGSEFYGVRVKEKDALLEKLKRKGRPVKTMPDILGGRIVADTPRAIRDLVAEISERSNVIEIDDKLNGSAGSYRAVHMIVTSDKGVSAEIQIQPREIREVQDVAHQLYYTKWRNVKADAMTAAQKIERLADDEAQEKLFSDAWRAWEERTGGEAGPFDQNAYALQEYRQRAPVPPSEIKPTDRALAARSTFDELVADSPDMEIMLENGTAVKLVDYAATLKADERMLEALTTCRIA